MFVGHTVMWATGPWSPPPPDTRSLAWFALVGWITIPWAVLADRRGGTHNRRPKITV